LPLNGCIIMTAHPGVIYGVAHELMSMIYESLIWRSIVLTTGFTNPSMSKYCLCECYSQPSLPNSFGACPSNIEFLSYQLFAQFPQALGILGICGVVLGRYF